MICAPHPAMSQPDPPKLISLPDCRRLLMESGPLVAAVEAGLKRPAVGYIDETDMTRALEWLDTPEGQVFRNPAHDLGPEHTSALKHLKLLATPPNSSTHEPGATPLTARRASPAPELLSDRLLGPEWTEHKLREFWNSPWILDVMGASEELQAEAELLLGQTYRVGSKDDFMNFLIQLHKPENKDKRAVLTAWLLSVRFHLKHTPAPREISIAEKLRTIAKLQYKQSIAAKISFSEPVFSAFSPMIQGARKRVFEGLEIHELRDLAENVNDIAEGYQHRLSLKQRGAGLDAKDIDYFLVEFLELGFHVLLLAEWAAAHEEISVETALKEFVEKQIIGNKLDQMFFESFEEMKTLLALNPSTEAAYMAVRERLIQFSESP